jgi:integrase
VTLRYVQEFRDRHGKMRRYFRRPGWPRVLLPGAPGSPEFMEVYNAAVAGHRVERTLGIGQSGPGSVSAAIAGYYCDNSFTRLSPVTRKARRAILEKLRTSHGDKPIALLQRQHILGLLGKKTPYVAQDWLKVLRGLMKFAVAIGLCPEDPTADIEPLKIKGGTIHTWTEDEIAAYEQYYQIGTRARLAMTLMLYTAARRGDAVNLGPQHVRAGRLTYRQRKTGRVVSMPVHQALAAAIAATPSGHLTFLATEHGAAFTRGGFGNQFRKWCRAAGVPECSPHGLRKACARRLAEAGCSAHEIASITGHKTLAEVQRYADAADRERMADAAMGRIANIELSNPRSGLSNLVENPQNTRGSK